MWLLLCSFFLQLERRKFILDFWTPHCVSCHIVFCSLGQRGRHHPLQSFTGSRRNCVSYFWPSLLQYHSTESPQKITVLDFHIILTFWNAFTHLNYFLVIFSEYERHISQEQFRTNYSTYSKILRCFLETYLINVNLCNSSLLFCNEPFTCSCHSQTHSWWSRYRL